MNILKALEGVSADINREEGLIDGKWVAALSGKRFPVIDPATGETIATVPDMGAADAEDTITAAQAVLPMWRDKIAGERSRILRRWFELIRTRKEELALLMTREQGKPPAESRGEIDYGASFVEWFAEEVKGVYGDVIPAPTSDKRSVVLKQPVGVVAAITPWNFPVAMITRKCTPSLATGCPVIVKQAENTPLCALALTELALQAGVPLGVFNVVTTAHGAEIGKALTSETVVRKLSFTGSTEVGRLLLGDCAPALKKVSLELGGNAPFVVFDDADREAAVAGAMGSKFRNGGADVRVLESAAGSRRSLRPFRRIVEQCGSQDQRGSGRAGRRHPRAADQCGCHRKGSDTHCGCGVEGRANRTWRTVPRIRRPILLSNRSSCGHPINVGNARRNVWTRRTAFPVFN